MNKKRDVTDNPLDKALGKRVADAIITRGTNTLELSRRTGISYRPLCKSLKGERQFPVRELANIANALEVPTAALIPDALAGWSAE